MIQEKDSLHEYDKQVTTEVSFTHKFQKGTEWDSIDRKDQKEVWNGKQSIILILTNNSERLKNKKVKN